MRKLLALVFIFTFGILMYLPLESKAYPEYSQDGSCIECHDESYEALGGAEGGTEGGADGEGGASETDEVAGASQNAEPLPHYEPLPVEPIHREANNVLLGSGLGIAALAIVGSIIMDQRKK